MVCGLVFQQAAAQDGSRSSDPAASLDADAAAFCEHAISCLDVSLLVTVAPIASAFHDHAGFQSLSVLVVKLYHRMHRRPHSMTLEALAVLFCVSTDQSR